MSELIGKNGYVVGSVEYFKNLNEKSMVGDLLREFCGSSSSTQYSKAVDGVCKRAQDAIYDIHADLKKHAAFLRYFPKSERDSLIQVVKGLEELLKLGTYTRNSTTNACVSLLTLQSSETRPKSRESMQNLEAAAKLVKNGGKVRVTYATGYDLIKRAASDGVQRAAGSDLTKQTFFNAVVGNRSKEFVQDLWVLMQYQKEKHRLAGRCGKVICSRDYMNKIEAQVFGKAQSWVSDCESYYDEVHEGLKLLTSTIGMDLCLPGYLSKEAADIVNRILREISFDNVQLSKLTQQVNNKINLVIETNLDRKDQILRLQRNLNEMVLYGGINGGACIAEDGEYGSKTHNLMQQLLLEIAKGVPPRLQVDYLDRESTGLSIEYLKSRKKPPLGSEVYDYFDLTVVPDEEFEMPYLFEDIPGEFGEWKDYTFDDGNTVKYREQKKKLVMHADFPHYFEKDASGNKVFIDYHMNIEDGKLTQRHPFINQWVESVEPERIKGNKKIHIVTSESSYSFFKNFHFLKI